MTAFLWEGGTMVRLPSLPGSGFSGVALALNDLGQIVGFHGAEAVIWEAGDAFDLGKFPGDSSARANDINNLGKIAGSSGNRAVLWDDGQTIDLGRFESPYSERRWIATAINEQTDIVGWLEGGPNGGVAFLWTEDDGMQNLNCRAGESATGWSLIDALDINDSGWIVGVGFNAEGRQHGYLLIPNPKTIPGDTNADGIVDIDDLNMVRNNFGANVYELGPVGGNANHDCRVDVDDLNLVRNNFGMSLPVAKAVPEPTAVVVMAIGLVCLHLTGHSVENRTRADVEDGGHGVAGLFTCAFRHAVTVPTSAGGF